MPRLWQPRYFVVTLIAVALVVMGIRLESLVQSLFAGTAVTTIAVATAEDAPGKDADKAPTNPPEVAKDEKKDGDKAKDDKAETAASPEHAEVTSPHQAPPDDPSEGEVEILKQLSSRRAALDTREEDLQQRSLILQAAEARVDDKVKQMEALRVQLQKMLGQMSEAQQAQIDNLVKIYEVMKPKEAARILQTLDQSVLLGVMRQMKPAKSAPILAEMDAPKAKDITMTLARQHDLPDSKAAQ